jgi:hypothetical protein
MDIETITTRGENTLLTGLRSALASADQALLCVAFAQAAGVHLLRRELDSVGASTRLLVTTTFGQSAPEALHMARGLGISVSIMNPGSGTFHPKMYLARSGSAAVAVIGSSNLTGGLVTNIEVAVMLRGRLDDPPIRTAWDLAEDLWNDPHRQPWTPGAAPVQRETLGPELQRLLTKAWRAQRGLFRTLDQGKPNQVIEVTPGGLYVETEASKAKGSPPQLIPAWMFTLAWDYLRTHGRLTNRYLLATDGLNVKRSSGVMAILAALPGVTAQVTKREGITLTLHRSRVVAPHASGARLDELT